MANKKMEGKTLTEKSDAVISTKKGAIKPMIDSIKARVDAGEVLRLGDLAKEHGRTVDDMVAKINDAFGEEYEYNMDDIKFFKSPTVNAEPVKAEAEEPKAEAEKPTA
jgi:hypothetical protein